MATSKNSPEVAGDEPGAAGRAGGFGRADARHPRFGADDDATIRESFADPQELATLSPWDATTEVPMVPDEVVRRLHPGLRRGARGQMASGRAPVGDDEGATMRGFDVDEQDARTLAPWEGTTEIPEFMEEKMNFMRNKRASAAPTAAEGAPAVGGSWVGSAGRALGGLGALLAVGVGLSAVLLSMDIEVAPFQALFGERFILLTLAHALLLVPMIGAMARTGRLAGLAAVFHGLVAVGAGLGFAMGAGALGDSQDLADILLLVVALGPPVAWLCSGLWAWRARETLGKRWAMAHGSIGIVMGIAAAVRVVGDPNSLGFPMEIIEIMAYITVWGSFAAPATFLALLWTPTRRSVSGQG